MKILFLLVTPSINIRKCNSIKVLYQQSKEIPEMTPIETENFYSLVRIMLIFAARKMIKCFSESKK